MAQVVTVIYSSRSTFIADVGYTADADVGGVVAHGIRGGLGSAGVVPEVTITAVPPTPATKAARAAAAVEVTLVDATNVTIDKTNAGGSGSALPHVRLVVQRRAASLDPVRNATVGAIAGAGAASE